MGCVFSPYLIDWLTLKLPISATSHPALFARVAEYSGHVAGWDCDGEILWQKRVMDIDALRTDSPGLYWQLTGDGKSDVLVIGASPASLEHGLNLWGSCDIQHCADVLIAHASKSLQLLLPGRDSWSVRRLDITANYALPDSTSVKAALAQMLVSDGSRRRAGSGKGAGDTVSWNPSSDLKKGKAYHKGPQVLHLVKKNKLGQTAYPLQPEHFDLMHQLVRLEHTLGSRWFRRLEEGGGNWQHLTTQKLIDLHTEFFTPLLGHGIEVKHMERTQIIAAIMIANQCTENQAKAAFTTYRNCREDGFIQTQDSMVKRTFQHHQKLLRAAGISDMHLRTAKLIPFPKVRFDIARPVASWDDIRRAA
jgi:II/X family phage/plasmid replication protein